MKRVTKYLMLAGLIVAGVAWAVLWTASVGDTIGFSSNRDFYFDVRHPVRAAILSAALWAGLAAAIIAGVAWAWLACVGNRRE
ncbi:hypothetical protein [Paracoccus pacificus]|uniref:Heme biosynthesis protein HemY n=1 Tax=Paracoccus pacificus TaxID=1463598 RepID=A0ABW4R4L6_9RHOB